MNTLREISLTTFRSTQQLKSNWNLFPVCFHVSMVWVRESVLLSVCARALRQRRQERLVKSAKVNKVVGMIAGRK